MFALFETSKIHLHLKTFMHCLLMTISVDENNIDVESCFSLYREKLLINTSLIFRRLCNFVRLSFIETAYIFGWLVTGWNT